MINDRRIIIDDLISLATFQGEHNGRWQDEYAIEDSCDKYLSDMKKLADKYHFDYNDNLEEFRECEDDYNYELKDRFGFFLFESLKDMMIDKLL